MTEDGRFPPSLNMQLRERGVGRVRKREFQESTEPTIILKKVAYQYKQFI